MEQLCVSRLIPHRLPCMRSHLTQNPMAASGRNSSTDRRLHLDRNTSPFGPLLLSLDHL